MTWSKFHKNCIFTGLLDGYCLVCEDHMKDIDDYNTHIQKPIHKKNLDAAIYFDKYKNECIRKVKKGYYCEACNALFFTASKVGLHVGEKQHSEKKGIHLLKRIDNNKLVIAFDNILISDKAWNGIVDDTCVICNVEFDNLYIHKTSQEHILHVIQKNVEFYDDNMTYRKVDDSTFQCLTCNVVMGFDTFSTHSKDDKHIERLNTARTAGELTLEDIEKKPNVKSTPDSKVENQANLKTDVASKTDKDPVVTQTIKGPAKSNVATKTQNKSVDVTPTKTTEKLERGNIKNAIEMDKYICNVLQAKNYVTPNQNGQCMCLLCDWTMDSDAVYSHVQSRHHITLLEMHKKRLEKLSNTQVPPVQVNEEVLDSEKDDDKSKILESLPEFQKNDININFEMNVATCKKCSKSFNLSFDVLKNHVKDHKKKVNKKDSKPLQFQTGANGAKSKENGNTSLFTRPVLMKDTKEPHSRASSVVRDDEEIASFSKKNNLTYSNGQVTCQVCHSKLSASMKCLKEHVEGAQHKSKNKGAMLSVSPYKSPNLRLEPMNKFINSIATVQDFLLKTSVINEKYSINILSFFMITAQNNVLKCEHCDEILEVNQVDSHRLSQRHMRAMNETMVVVSLENEFVREVRPGVYHCGYCNEVAFGWERFTDHLATTSHRESRNAANWRLQEYASELAKKKWQDNMEKNMLAFMLSRLRDRNDSSDDEW